MTAARPRRLAGACLGAVAGLLVALAAAPLYGQGLVFLEAQLDGVDGVEGLGDARVVAVSPDGANVYAGGTGSNALVTFRRDADGRLGFVQVLRDGVGGVDGLAHPISIAISPDGMNVYVGAFDESAVSVFARDPASGALTFLEVFRDGVGGVDGLADTFSVAVSPDGGHLYGGGGVDDAVAIFARRPEDGRLTFLGLVRDGIDGVDGLDGVSTVEVSQDGANVYVASFDDNAIAVFDRDGQSGGLTFIQVIKERQPPGQDPAPPPSTFLTEVDGLLGAAAAVLSPDGENLYAAASTRGEVPAFKRDPTDGRLVLLELEKNGQGGVTGLESANALVVSPGGSQVYVTGPSSNALVVFDRSAEGDLAHRATLVNGSGGIEHMRSPLSVAVSPDGRNLYLASPVDKAVVVLARGQVAPLAADDVFATAEDTPLAGNLLADNGNGPDSDANGDPLAIAAPGTFATALGSVVITADGSFLYTPERDRSGVDGFDYAVTDGNGGSDLANVAITVTPVNDPPVARDDAFLVSEEGSLGGNVLADNGAGPDFDVDGDPLVVVNSGSFSSRAGGRVTLAGDGGFLYVPPAGFVGSDDFGYSLDDGAGGGASASATITVQPQNDPPLARDDGFVVAEDELLSGNLFADNGNGPDSDPEGSALTLDEPGMRSTAAGGLVNLGPDGTFTYLPAADFHGLDGFGYSVTDDDGASAAAAVAITVTPVNDPPRARDDLFTIEQNRSLRGNLLSDNGAGPDEDPDGDRLAITSSGTATSANGGLISVEADGGFTFTPGADFLGEDSFGYTVSDGSGGSDSARVRIRVVAPTVGPPLAASVLPGSRSATIGTAVTAFASLINAGEITASACSVALATAVPAAFAAQAVDSGGSLLPEPLNIAPGGVASLVLAITPSAAFAARDLAFTFACDNAEPAPVIVGVNTLLLSASVEPVIDAVALAATASGNGILEIPDAAGTAAFSLAAVNLGAAGSVTLSADSGTADLPLSFQICRSDARSGACQGVSEPAPTVMLASGATPTFSVFVTANGPIAADPAHHRIFVRFRDGEGLVRGATSVAVQTGGTPAPPEVSGRYSGHGPGGRTGCSDPGDNRLGTYATMVTVTAQDDDGFSADIEVSGPGLERSGRLSGTIAADGAVSGGGTVLDRAGNGSNLRFSGRLEDDELTLQVSFADIEGERCIGFFSARTRR